MSYLDNLNLLTDSNQLSSTKSVENGTEIFKSCNHETQLFDEELVGFEVTNKKTKNVGLQVIKDIGANKRDQHNIALKEILTTGISTLGPNAPMSQFQFKAETFSETDPSKRKRLNYTVEETNKEVELNISMRKPNGEQYQFLKDDFQQMGKHVQDIFANVTHMCSLSDPNHATTITNPETTDKNKEDAILNNTEEWANFLGNDMGKWALIHRKSGVYLILASEYAINKLDNKEAWKDHALNAKRTDTEGNLTGFYCFDLNNIQKTFPDKTPTLEQNLIAYRTSVYNAKKGMELYYHTQQKKIDESKQNQTYNKDTNTTNNTILDKQNKEELDSKDVSETIQPNNEVSHYTNLKKQNYE